MPITPEHFTALLYDYRGVDHSNEGNYDQAITDFGTAIEVYPALSFPLIHRGVAYREHGNYDQAIADFTKDLTLEPTWGRDYYDRGLAYQGKGDNAQAIADLQKYLQFAPNASDRAQVLQLINQLNDQALVLPVQSTPLVGTWQTSVLERGISTTIIWQAHYDGTENYQFVSSSGTHEAFGTWQYSDGVLVEKISNGYSARSAIRWIDNNNFETTILDNGVSADTGSKRDYRRE